MIIPISEIPKETLNNLIEAFVLREGTDYGDEEFTLEQKVNHVMTQLHSGEAVIQYSELHESVNIVKREDIDP